MSAPSDDLGARERELRERDDAVRERAKQSVLLAERAMVETASSDRDLSACGRGPPWRAETGSVCGR